jgi:hypothetical protein
LVVNDRRGLEKRLEGVHVIRLLFVAAVLLLLVSGCGESLDLVPVTGTVTYQGKPVEGANVAFLPEKGPPGTGITDAAGKYTISTNGQPGASAGKNAVTITKTSTGGTASPTTPEEMQKMASEGKMPTSKSEIPSKYSAIQAGLTAEVSDSKKVFDFTLTD